MAMAMLGGLFAKILNIAFNISVTSDISIAKGGF
jgi:hypothetical protein